MNRLVFYGLLLCPVVIDAGWFGFGKKDPTTYAAETRRLVHQGKWATFTTLSADGYPATTVLSTADNIKGEIFFYMLDEDIPAVDASSDNRITFTFSDGEKARFRFRDDDPTHLTALISGHVKKLDYGPQRTSGLRAFLFHHPEAFEWSRSCFLRFSLCKFDVTSALVFYHNGEVGQVSSEEYYAATDSDDESGSTAREIATRPDVAAEARRLVNQAKWATSTAILVDGYPMTVALSTTDSEGEIFFHQLDAVMPAMDIANGSRMTLMFSDAQEIDCNDRGDDPWSPNCAKAVISGCVQKLEVGSEEHNRSLEALLTRHLNALELGRVISHNLYKLNITAVVVLFRYGGGGQVTPQEYYAATHAGVDDAYLMKQPGTRPNIAAEARRLVHQAKNSTTVIYLSDRHAVVYFLPPADRKGQIYFYVSNTNAPAMDTNRNNTFVFSHVRYHKCNDKRGSTWSPHCAEATVLGYPQKIEVGTEELNRSMSIFLRRHPTALSWDSSSDDYSMWKLVVTKVKVAFRYGSTHYVSSEEYYAGTETNRVGEDKL